MREVQWLPQEATIRVSFSAGEHTRKPDRVATPTRRTDRVSEMPVSLPLQTGLHRKIFFFSDTNYITPSPLRHRPIVSLVLKKQLLDCQNSLSWTLKISACYCMLNSPQLKKKKEAIAMGVHKTWQPRLLDMSSKTSSVCKKEYVHTLGHPRFGLGSWRLNI